MPTFSISTRIFFGKSAFDELTDFLAMKNLKSILFLFDSNLTKNEYLNHMIQLLINKAFKIVKIRPIFLNGEASYDYLDNIAEEFRNKHCAAIIAVGGGSVMDLAKGIGVLLNNPGKALNYRGMDKVENFSVPVICIPTTAGSGSEVTDTASLIDWNSKTKLGINGKNVAPICGALIPELSMSCPRDITVAAGLDAMLHAVEAVITQTASTVTRMIGSTAYGLLYSNFKKVIEEPLEYDARGAMLLGSYYAGIAMMNAGGGPASAVSYPLGVHFKVPHGIAGGIFLLPVIEYNVSKGFTGYAEIYDKLPDADLSLSNIEKSLDFSIKFKQILEDIGAPVSLGKYGVFKKDIDWLVNLTMEQRKQNLDLNPVRFGREAVNDLLERVIAQ